MESMEKVFNGLEQVDEWVQAGCHVLGCLVHADVTKIHLGKFEKGTYGE
jgi:hypothetical protein